MLEHPFNSVGPFVGRLQKCKNISQKQLFKIVNCISDQNIAYENVEG